MEYNIKLLLAYTENFVPIIAYMISLILIVLLEKDRIKKAVTVFTAIIIPVLLLNPIFGSIMGKYGDEVLKRTVRLYWLIPSTFTCAFAAVLLISFIGDRYENVLNKEPDADDMGKGIRHIDMEGLCFLIIALFTIFFGVSVFSGEGYKRADNLQKVSRQTRITVDMVREDAAKRGIADPVCAFPFQTAPQVRQYDGSLRQLYGRFPDGTSEDAKHVYEWMYNYPRPLDKMGPALYALDCDYVVIEDGVGTSGSFGEKKVTEVGSYETYHVYYLGD